MKNDPLRQTIPIVLAIGAAIGLVIGLLIGWVFWPVEWTGATLNDLYPQAKAEYIAAVADAYAIYDNQEARAVAQRRLAHLDNAELQQSFEEALQYFRESDFSDRAIRDSNIRRLAVALSMSQPVVAAAGQEQPAIPAAATAAATAVLAAPSAPSQVTGGLSWLGWLLWLLTALVLLAGGIYILSKTGLPNFQSLWKPRQQAADAIDEFDDPPAQPRRHQSNTRPTAALRETEGTYPFDQEDDDWQSTVQHIAGQTRRSSLRSPAEDERRHASTYDAYTSDDGLPEDFDDARYTSKQLDADFADAEFDDADFDDSDFDDDGFDDDGFDDDAKKTTQARSAATTESPFDDEDEEADRWQAKGHPYTIDVSQHRDRPDDALPMPQPMKPDVEEETDPGSQREEPPNATLVDRAPTSRRQGVRSAPTPDGKRTAAQTRSRYKVIDQHIFHYRIGMAEYDESRPIVDPQSGKYIGEFGMGASQKNGIAQTGPDQLVALEVWLFDKSDERNLGNQTRILLSEYATDHKLEQMFLKERQDNPRPFTAQPGIHFQLESQNLLLDCTIVDVEYSANDTISGIFQEITVDMTVQQKK